jgi:hypothetical protein
MIDELPVAWTTCQNAIESSRYAVGLRQGRRTVGVLSVTSPINPQRCIIRQLMFLLNVFH